jgi:hypothetical protein
VISSAILALALTPLAAQVDSNIVKTYAPSKTPWGDPDLQGMWPTTERIPLQRGTDTAGTGGRRANAAPANGRALIVDPPDGRMPPITAEATKRRADARGGRGFPAEWKGEANAPEDMNLYYRCITRGLIGSIMYSSYNNGNDILQTPGYVVIRNEMIHEARVIPLDGRAHLPPAIRGYMGDSRGHTLVVETTNFTDKTTIGSNGAGYNGEGGRHTEAMRITERFTRTAPGKLEYRATLDDPKTWTKPWTIAFSIKEDPSYQLLEYACHEGNYALEDILSGARVEEELAAKGASK